MQGILDAEEHGPGSLTNGPESYIMRYLMCYNYSHYNENLFICDAFVVYLCCKPKSIEINFETFVIINP